MTSPEGRDKVSLFLADDGWRWRRTAGNNEIVAASTEAYESSEDARANLLRVNANAVLSDTDHRTYYVTVA